MFLFMSFVILWPLLASKSSFHPYSFRSIFPSFNLLPVPNFWICNCSCVAYFGLPACWINERKQKIMKLHNSDDTMTQNEWYRSSRGNANVFQWAFVDEGKDICPLFNRYPKGLPVLVSGKPEKTQIDVEKQLLTLREDQMDNTLKL